MKKNDLILIGILIIVVVLGFFLMKGEKLGNGRAIELSYEEYIEKVDNGEKFVLIVERATCSHCVAYMPIVKKFARSKNVNIYYVDTDTFTEKNWEKFEKTNSFFIEKNESEEGWGTPTTLFLDGDEAVDYLVGQTTEDVLEDYLDKYNDFFEKVEE